MNPSRESDTWIAVEAWVSNAVQQAMERLESPATDDRQTQYLRGRIAALKEVLALPDRRPTPTLKSDTYF